MNPIESPVPPENFSLILNEFQPGKYIIGLDKLTLSEFHITNILQRQFSSAEEYILGILSVFLIAILSDIAQTLLLRTTNRHVHFSSLISAYMVHELSHFRNIWAHIKPSHPLHAQRALWTRRRAWLSFMVISITLGLFAADVIAVLLTQPNTASSSKDQYNLVAIQPLGTSLGLSRYIRRITGNRPCVSPIMTGSDQTRNFLISACTQYEVVEALSGDEDVSDIITIASWFHRGGSDHNITIGSGRIGIKIRAEVLLEAEKGGGRRFLFRSLDDASLNHAKYLHELTFYGAIDWACKRFETRTCEELKREIRIESRIERRKIKLWRGRKDDVFTEADGRVSTARIRMNAPFLAMNSGLRALVSSAGILEVGGNGQYVRVANDAEEDGIEGLLSEDGRVAGVALFGILLMILVSIMVGLRVFLKPVSLGYVALSGIQQQSGVDLVENDYFEGVEDEEYWDYMEGLGAAGLGERSYSIPGAARYGGRNRGDSSQEPIGESMGRTVGGAGASAVDEY